MKTTTMKTTTRIIDTTSGDTITGRVGRFCAISHRRGDTTQVVHEGERALVATGHGKRALVAALRAAAAQAETARRNDWVTTVSLYDSATRTWWPCEIAD